MSILYTFLFFRVSTLCIIVIKTDLTNLFSEETSLFLVKLHIQRYIVLQSHGALIFSGVAFKEYLLYLSQSHTLIIGLLRCFYNSYVLWIVVLSLLGFYIDVLVSVFSVVGNSVIKIKHWGLFIYIIMQWYIFTSQFVYLRLCWSMH